jgi:type VI protein secretion system component VasF
MADLVFPVFASGLKLHEKLRRGDQLDFGAEQEHIKRLLKTREDAMGKTPEFGGDADRFLGARYALACWLDELFIIDSPWSDKWQNFPIEDALFGTRDRAWLFWFQAKLAEGRANKDSLEVFYLAVMLGMRGDGPESEAGVPADKSIPTWREAAEAQLTREQNQAWDQMPQELRPEVNAVPRRGKERLRRVLTLLLLVGAVLIPTLAYFVVSLGKK